jgi:glycosyltransferase involved in cell wall biosynthesis
MLRALETHYGKLYQGRVIPNGRDAASFGPAEKQDFILSAGRLWDQAKNVSAVAEIADELPWPFFVAGDSEPPHQTEQPDTIERKCYSLGQLSESYLRNWFGAASIYALPALYEPFGYTPLEAALSGCALVLGDIESLREIWDGAAVFVKPQDTHALKSELLQLIRNPNYRDDMASRALERASQFTSERMAQNYLSVYAELLAQAPFFRRQESFAQCA